MFDLVVREGIAGPGLWDYTPLALGWTTGITASAVIYDCTRVVGSATISATRPVVAA